MRSFQNICNFLKLKHHTRNFTSILKNKDLAGEADKSYSGTDTKHVLGSNRVLNDNDKKILNTTVNDSKVHQDHKVSHRQNSTEQSVNVTKTENPIENSSDSKSENKNN